MDVVHARTQKVAMKMIPASGIVIARQLSRWKALFCDFPSEFAENSGLRKMRPRGAP